MNNIVIFCHLHLHFNTNDNVGNALLMEMLLYETILIIIIMRSELPFVHY